MKITQNHEWQLSGLLESSRQAGVKNQNGPQLDNWDEVVQSCTPWWQYRNSPWSFPLYWRGRTGSTGHPVTLDLGQQWPQLCLLQTFVKRTWLSQEIYLGSFQAVNITSFPWTVTPRPISQNYLLPIASSWGHSLYQHCTQSPWLWLEWAQGLLWRQVCRLRLGVAPIS